MFLNFLRLVFLLVTRGIKTIASFASVVGIQEGFTTLIITLFVTLGDGLVKLLVSTMKKKNKHEKLEILAKSKGSIFN